MSEVEKSPLRLVEIKNGERGRVFNLKQGNNLVGRWDPDSQCFPEIDLEELDPEVKVSRKHAIVECAGDYAEVEDLNSLNGTFINRGQRLRAGVRERLKNGDEIIFGKTFLLFETDTD